MKNYRLHTSIVVYVFGSIILAYFSGKEILSPSFRVWSLEITSPIIFFLGWAIFGGYYLVYDKISDLAEKWIEGIITGLSVSFFLYITDKFFVIREYQNHSDFWGDYSWTTVTKRTWLPNEVIFLIIFYFIIWLVIDIWKLKFDNAIVKFVLFIISIISYLIIPIGNELKIILTTVITTILAVGYYSFRQIKSTRIQISTLLYVTLSLGVIATIIKHWDFFSRKLLLQEYTFSGLAEVFSDFVVFLLGFLLTLFESSKIENPQSQGNLPVQEVYIENKDMPEKTNFFSHPAVVLIFLVGVLAMIKSIYLALKSGKKDKRLIETKTG